jgi:osmoprotectant transport system permease protein
VSGLGRIGLAVMVLCALFGVSLAGQDVRVAIGSKPFGESYLLAELFAQLLEARGHAVTRRPGLGGTEILFPALVRGDIDVYPEYTGSGLRVILKQDTRKTPVEVFDIVSRTFATEYDLRWLPPLGFENTYAMSVRTEMAERLGLRTLSDAARVSGGLRAGFTADFIGQVDGLPALREAYGLEPREVNALAPAVKYQALASGSVDIIDAYSTDGLLARFPLTVLEDDRRVFPPYDAAALVRGALVRERPAAVAALAELSGRLDVHRMRRLNERVEVNGEPVARVAADTLRELGLVSNLAAIGVDPQDRRGAATGVIAYLRAERLHLWRMTVRHLVLVGLSLGLAVLAGVALGLSLDRIAAAETVIRAVGVLQTIPGLALLAFMIPVLGIGTLPAVAALFLYSLYPIVRNTFTGIRGADADAVAAAHALGMTPGQVLRFVRMPLAAPVIVAGIRTAAVVNVGTATLAALVGAGGLGDPIVAGLALADTRMILSGAVPAALLALLADVALGWLQTRVTPAGPHRPM